MVSFILVSFVTATLNIKSVPVYDGRNFTINFDTNLEYLADLPRWRDEIPIGSFTVVGYTVGVYKAQSNKWSVSFNIQWAIILGIPEI